MPKWLQSDAGLPSVDLERNRLGLQNSSSPFKRISRGGRGRSSAGSNARGGARGVPAGSFRDTLVDVGQDDQFMDGGIQIKSFGITAETETGQLHSAEVERL